MIPNQEIGQFKPGQSGNPNGRPKKIYTVLKESGYSKDDIRSAFEEIGWQTMDQLHNIYKDPNAPAILKVIAHAFKRGVEKGDFKYVSEILQHVVGKPKETIESNMNHSGGVTVISRPVSYENKQHEVL